MSDRIQVESEAYRRGIVLGLTLAEVGILLVFVLLMLIGFEHYRHESDAEQASLPRKELEALRSRDAALRELEQSLPGAPAPISDDFVRLVLDAAAQIDQPGAVARLRKVTAELEATRHELEADLDAAAQHGLGAELEKRARQIAADHERIEELETELARANRQVEGKEGQLAQLQRTLTALGRGRVYPACQTTPDGRVRYIYDISLTDGGLAVHAQPTEMVESDLPELPELAGRTVSPAEFLRLTAPLYRWSLAHDCRFFVRVYDATGPEEKARFKALLATVEAHFYKYLSSRARPKS